MGVIFDRNILVYVEGIRVEWYLCWYELLEDCLTDPERKVAYGTKAVVDGMRGAWAFGGFLAGSMLPSALFFGLRVCALLES